MRRDPERPSWPDVRDALLFVSGLVLTIHEAFFVQGDRPDLLVLYAAMMGLPAYLMGIRSRNGKG